ncbi:MAG: 3-deoxy-manno-octulosonate cytidylyltransferase [Chitinophagales bacterium]|nr:3-deoxy-manno-octulosonate cytidylyltransferase [Chitinophagales bacterium]
MNIIAIIPARYSSTRFPGKPLALIHGKPMIQRVYEQVMKSQKLSNVVVATDDARIEQAVKNFGGHVVMTSGLHQSGTERCAEVITKLPDNFDYVINVQGDEPFIQSSQIDLLCTVFTSPEVKIATLVKKISRSEELFNPNVVKTVINNAGEAMYFSRSPIPHHRSAMENYWVNLGNYYKHIGMYGYEKNTLAEIVTLPLNELEKAESLEQLRWLANGIAIRTTITEEETISIDTPEDLQQAEKFYRDH